MSERHTITTKEKPDLSHERGEDDLGKIDIFLQRHGHTESSGWLDDEGRSQVESATRKVVERYVSPDASPVTFFVLHSDSARFIDGEPAGKRAQETGEITARAIEAIIEERDLKDKVQLHSFGQKTKLGTRAHKRLREPNYHFVDGSPDPTGYKQALINTYGPEGREEAFFHEAEDLEGVRQEIGADSSSDVASRSMKLICAINRYAEAYRRAHSDRKLVFFLESHGDIIRSLVQHEFGISNIQGWQPTYGEVVPVELENGTLIVERDGIRYEKSLATPK